MIDVKVKTLLTVVRAGSFTKAAEELGLTHSILNIYVSLKYYDLILSLSAPIIKRSEGRNQFPS